jgi:hypothetical protein
MQRHGEPLEFRQQLWMPCRDSYHLLVNQIQTFYAGRVGEDSAIHTPPLESMLTGYRYLRNREETIDIVNGPPSNQRRRTARALIYLLD